MRSPCWGWMILWGVSSCSSLRDDRLPGTDAAVEATVVTDTVDLEVEVDVLRVDARSCPGDQVDCGDTCVDLTSSALHCGACGRACDAGQTCVGGACRVICPPGQTNCMGTCRDLSVDYGNCGACGRACDAGQVCSAGACVTSCGRGTTLCGGACVMTATDPGNCGGCGVICPPRMNASAVCAGSACSFVCSAGAADCDRLAPNGCETSLTVDPRNCGACGRLCSLPQAYSACRGGACAVSLCVTGFADCDGNPTNGCEVAASSDVAHCGTCSTRCGAGQMCLAGSCRTPCGATTCASGQICSDNSCVPSSWHIFSRWDPRDIGMYGSQPFHSSAASNVAFTATSATGDVFDVGILTAADWATWSGGGGPVGWVFYYAVSTASDHVYLGPGDYVLGFRCRSPRGRCTISNSIYDY